MTLITIREDITGAAITPTDTDLGTTDDEYVGLVRQALELAYPNVEWCTLDEHNLLVKGNSWDDVNSQVSIDALTSLTPEQLRTAIDTMRAATEARDGAEA